MTLDKSGLKQYTTQYYRKIGAMSLTFRKFKKKTVRFTGVRNNINKKWLKMCGYGCCRTRVGEWLHILIQKLKISIFGEFAPKKWPSTTKIKVNIELNWSENRLTLSILSCWWAFYTFLTNWPWKRWEMKFDCCQWVYNHTKE